MYAKLINNNIQYAPKNYTTEQGVTIFNFNTDEELMQEYGFKPLIQAVRPSTGRQYVITYEETETEIREILTYTETEEEYEERIERQRKEQRNLEINEKIRQLNEMALSDVLQNNKANIELYNEVINGLEQARPV